MSKKITRLTTALAREVHLIPTSEELTKGEINYKHGSGCGGTCCRDKEPRVQFSGEHPSGEKVAFTCHIDSR